MKKIIASVATVAMLTASAGMVFAGSAKDGEKLFKKKCKACHTVDGKKKVGPTLQGVLGRDSKIAGHLDEAGLKTWLKDPAAVNKDSKMAKTFKSKLSDGDIADLVEYMKGL